MSLARAAGAAIAEAIEIAMTAPIRLTVR
jgi:hypothetical protein